MVRSLPYKCILLFFSNTYICIHISENEFDTFGQCCVKTWHTQIAGSSFHRLTPRPQIQTDCAPTRPHLMMGSCLFELWTPKQQSSFRECSLSLTDTSTESCGDLSGIAEREPHCPCCARTCLGVKVAKAVARPTGCELHSCLTALCIPKCPGSTLVTVLVPPAYFYLYGGKLL